MRRDVVSSVIAMVVFTVLLGLAYPLFVTGVSEGVFPGNANGQQVRVAGNVVGSRIIGQNFGSAVLEKGKREEVKGAVVTEPDPRYFQSRPSATEGGAANAAASTFSNKGPNSVRTEEADAENVKAYLELNRRQTTGAEYDPGLTAANVPVDAVNTSASGLDPEISKANAWIQAYRVAAVRGIARSAVDRLISAYTSARALGFSGEEGVNVLELNLALDRMGGGK